ncbi:hypothetical protein [Pedobacter nototheniae]|uniref:hypothetical protein n=1 Tax=Pedobacter nototheniae TaxID=2488994 RepID=UPI00103D6E50|nr:hypothetical protein [Pedobacter nototheniae]
MKKLLYILIFVCIAKKNFGQEFPKTIFLDESTLIKETQTTMVNDVTANKSSCMFRSSGSYQNTMWWGPYFHVAAGNYLVQFRLKVASNASSNDILSLDIVGSSGGFVYKRVSLKPNMFKTNNEWQLITISLSLPENESAVEIRGINFQPGLTDLYFDYVQLVPNDNVGLLTDELTLAGNGNVGIGTTTPKEKLSVNGNIRAKEVKVETTGWPDYVFKSDYVLPTLAETEKYINEKGYLPGMPSAKEVELNGLELGEMNKRLLQKVEELTLHLIEKDKELSKEKEMNKVQNERLQTIEALLKKIIEKNNNHHEKN